MRATSSATRKRLDDVIVGPEVQAKHHVGLLSLRRQHQDRHIESVRAHRPADLKAIHLWQHHVQQDQVRNTAHSRIEPALVQDRSLVHVTGVLPVRRRR